MTRSPAERLGERLRNELPHAAPPGDYAALRNRLVEAAVSEPRRRQRLWLGAVATLLVVALPLTFLGMRAAHEDAPAALSFRAGASGSPGAVGTYYTAPDAHTLPLAFSDGSRVSLDKNAGLRVTETDRARTAVLLETGSADFDIVHHGRRSWDVLAGPYRVHVTGTAFRLSWDASQRWLRLAMRSGSVVVTGPGLETGITVKGGAQFETRVTTGVTLQNDKHEAPASEEKALSPRKDAPAPVAAREGLERRADPTVALPPTRAPAAATSATPIPPPAAPNAPNAPNAPSAGPTTSSARNGGGTYDAVVARAEAHGISAFLGSESSSELRALADAARFTGRLGLCERALHSVRARFPSTADAAWASFVLGRLAEDSGRLRQAVGYYEEASGSGSSLRAEAFGRKMVALHRLGEHAQAAAVARQYLERYADGPYARQARELAPE
jgi:ferric-dicitrate binding protein FerR (iron transport regulator)